MVCFKIKVKNTGGPKPLHVEIHLPYNKSQHTDFIPEHFLKQALEKQDWSIKKTKQRGPCGSVVGRGQCVAVSQVDSADGAGDVVLQDKRSEVNVLDMVPSTSRPNDPVIPVCRGEHWLMTKNLHDYRFNLPSKRGRLHWAPGNG